ncbi:MAG: Stk1 family PASTA domain-containing Ser/Thr kinase, partial [Tissierellia bacterium]|nr:Stk1 family PASTA domain-containing Ser/Thr kinase [Tissierellia bacterium]
MENLLLGNRYRILKKVGTGGMAKVYKANDELLKRIVAVKVLKEQYVEDNEFLRKFNNEAQSAAKLSHINIVNVFDIGEDFIDGKKIYYIVMEYIEGETLKDFIDKNKVLSNEDIEDFSIQIAQALKCAHSSNIIHRDIKPQNILIDKFSLLKVTDFGIARVSSNATITYTNSILGTVHYISPEQAKGKFVDEKSDLYSLGVVMYEMATGKVPFDSDNSVGIAIMHIQDEPVEPKEINPRLSDKLNNIIMKLLSKNPADRFLSATSLVDALESPYVEENIGTETIKMKKIDDAQIKNNNNEKAVYIQEKTKKEDNQDQKPKKKNKFIPTIIILIFLLSVISVAYMFLKDSTDTKVTIPTVIDMSEESALKLLEDEGLKPVIKGYENSEDIQKGNVISQDPKAKQKVDKGSEVQLVISEGSEVEVPDLTNMTIDQAEDALDEVGLKLGKRSSEYSDDYEKDIIFDQSPKAGEVVDSNENIDIVVSLGSEQKEVEYVTVPDLYNLSREDALDQIENSGLKIGQISNRKTDEVDEDNVIYQSLEANSEVEKDSVIDIIVASKPDDQEEEKEEKE